MKRLFSYGLLIAALVLSFAMTGTHIWKKDLTIRNNQFVYLSHDVSQSGKDCLLTVPDTPSVPAGLNISSNSRLPVIIVKAENNPYSMLKSFFSKRTNQQLNTTKAIYTALYSQKEKEGYYIYTLRKLLI